jgi:ABC-2 type transport system ATP-binding protein
MTNPSRNLAPPSSLSAPVVELKALTKRFPVRRPWADLLVHPRSGQKAVAVDGLSFSVNAGEFFGLLGPNGAGKTTVFKMLSTLILPDGGSATIAGYDLVGAPGGVRSVLAPVIADERSLNWRISARENLRFYAGLYGKRGDAAARLVSELLELVELSDADHKMVGAFSSGMKQRLLLARTLLAKPRVMLLDEPTRSLDPVAARRFRTFLKEELVGRSGTTVLLATHNSEEALEMCDRVMVLNRGRSVAIGSPEELLRRSGDDHYQVWTRTPAHAAFEELPTGTLVSRNGSHRSGEWTAVELAIPGGEEQAAAVLRDLIWRGAEVGRFQKIELSLASMIEGLLDGESHHAV